MRAKKNVLKIAAAATLLGASGAALAVDCPDGILQDEIVESIELNGQACLIIGMSVRKGIVVQNSPAIVILETDVDNGVSVTNSEFVVVTNVRVQKGGIVVRDSGQAAVKDNSTKRNIRVVRNQGAVVNRNSADGSMVCSSNVKQDAFLNRANGNNSCR